jgi:hypothetical protein
MANAWEVPSESESRAFVAKLCQFRSTLTVSEQRLLDSLLLTGARPRGDVEAYGLLDPAERLAALLLDLLAEMGQRGLGIDERGEPTNLLPLAH